VPSRGCCAIEVVRGGGTGAGAGLAEGSVFRFALEIPVRIGGDAGGAKVVAQKPGEFAVYSHGDAFAPCAVVFALMDGRYEVATQQKRLAFNSG